MAAADTYDDAAELCAGGDTYHGMTACNWMIRTGAWSGADLAPAYLGRAEIEFNKGDIAHALTDFDKAIELKPDYAAAYAARSIAYAKQGDAAKASADEARARALSPNLAVEENAKGLQWAGKYQYDTAIASFTHAIALDPGFAEAYANRARVYYTRVDKPDYAQAVKDYGAAMKLKPRDVSFVLGRLWAYYAQGDVKQATDDAELARRLRPGLFGELLEQAHAFSEDRLKYKDAEDDYTVLILLKPRSATLYFERALVDDYLKPELALNDYGMAIKLKRSYAAAYQQRARLELYHNNDAAIADYTAAAKWGKPDADLYVGRASAYAAKNDDRSAIADYTRAIALKKDVVTVGDRAALEVKIGDTDAAIADYREMLELQPGDGSPLSSLAQIYLARHEPGKALECLNAYLKASSPDEDDLDMRGRAYMGVHDYEHAIADFVAAQAQVDPEHDGSDFHDHIGSAFLAEAKADPARADAIAAGALKDKNFDVLVTFGEANLVAGRFDAAIATLDPVLANDPKDASALYARGLAKVRRGSERSGKADIDAAIVIDPDVKKAFADQGLAP
jgi:tetratricopeptide (TPR) repeat protein